MNLMDLFIKVGVKDDASGPLKKLTGAVGGGLKVAAAAGVAAVGAAATAVGKLVTESVKAYGEYEQLVGGINKLYGDGADKLMAYAGEAYEKAGMSANQYMQNVTGFSAALINSLGGDTEQAAEIANMAMKDISDNANTFGKYTAEELAGVYQALAKGQYQTLDNLNLGFGGTKEGMQSLIDKANELREAQGLNADLTIESYADIVTAIHQVQDAMNITGTTKNEAATTIQGSLGMMKAAWQDLLTGMANPNGDIKKLFGNLKNSVKSFLGTLKPIVKQALSSIGELVAELGPEIAQELPGLMNDLLPDLISSALELVKGLGQALPGMFQMLMDNLPSLLDVGKQLFTDFADGFSGNIDGIVGSLNSLVDKIAEWFTNPDNLDALLTGGLKIVVALAKGILDFAVNITIHLTDLVDQIFEWFSKGENLQKLGDAGGEIVGALWEGMKAAWPAVARWAGASVAALSGNFSGAKMIWNAGSSNAIGNDYVPYNNYPAMLHRGEAVLTAREADAWRRGENGRQIVNNFSFNGVSQSDLDYIVGYVNRELVSG